jgi:hypothetical protein
MALVELGSRGVLLPDAKVELTSQWPDYLGAEPFEYTPPCSTELLRVHDLMERDGPSRHFNVADRRAFLVLLVGDDNAILIDALSGEDSSQQSVLPDMRGHLAVGMELAKYLFQFVCGRVAHLLRSIAYWRSNAESGIPKGTSP